MNPSTPIASKEIIFPQSQDEEQEIALKRVDVRHRGFDKSLLIDASSKKALIELATCLLCK